jgi:hypothetical protein
MSLAFTANPNPKVNETGNRRPCSNDGPRQIGFLKTRCSFAYPTQNTLVTVDPSPSIQVDLRVNRGLYLGAMKVTELIPITEPDLLTGAGPSSTTSHAA